MLRTVSLAAAMLIVGALPALADKGGNKGRSGGGDTAINVQINLGDHGIIRDYYGGQIARGHCPPGLAKKNNGCMPPGQAKKWAKGQRLPSTVIYHDLPPDLRGRLNPPPGARYVRIDSDIVLLATGTGMVIDALLRLGQG